MVPSDFLFHKGRKLCEDVLLEEPYLICVSAGRVICHCVCVVEIMSILEAFNSLPIGGRHNDICSAQKILWCGYKTSIHKDARDLCNARYLKIQKRIFSR